ncbi:MAG TPA: alpha-amylase family glycosyl hydrolase, partial [Burkholderiaceae bacterium]|nr:alpha-amylase family glycosyl hydrolase [Burkholderiaceae bacterium]
HSAPYLHDLIGRYERVAADGWPCWAISNHDCPRVATRWGGPEPHPAKLRAAAATLLSLRGSVCIYQGEELGLPEAEIAYEDLRDPYGLAMWPEFKGRDGCRTPMPWSADAPDMGFGSGNARPWLPLPEAHRQLAVDRQWARPDSLLHHYTQLLKWRRTHPALVKGSMTLLPRHEQVLAHVREHEGQSVLCAFNLSDDVATLTLPPGISPIAVLSDSGATGAVLHGDSVRFEPWGVLFAGVEVS